MKTTTSDKRATAELLIATIETANSSKRNDDKWPRMIWTTDGTARSSPLRRGHSQRGTRSLSDGGVKGLRPPPEKESGNSSCSSKSSNQATPLPREIAKVAPP